MSKKPSLDELADRIDELTEALQRERADAENIRRRHEEQYAGLQNLVKAKVIGDLLPALDNLERALKHVPKDLEGNDYVKGVEGTVKQFDKVLSDMGVQRIKTVGELFDPALHEAVGMEDGKGNVEVVCEELQPGYTVDGEVIRHAMVKVKMEAKK
jgi:molecular chaperone GrpE